jgi:hypothetical protein
VLERRRQEVELVVARYGELEYPSDYSHVVIKRWPLPPGWSAAATEVLILLPAGYPQTPPDSFYTPDSLTLEGSAEPDRASGRISHRGRSWRQFSWHFVEPRDWQPHPDPEQGHNLLTFLLAVEARLREPN